MSGKAAQPLDLLSTSQTHIRCVYGAPLVALIIAGHATISQACCNHWDCPACGIKRAKQEYRRIVQGSEQLEREGHDLYFWTITCRGRECSYDGALAGYLEWTNRLLTNARTKAKRAGQYWCYSQVTEHQKKTRNHPHSHLLTTFLPKDGIPTKDKNGRRVIISEWFSSANVSAGLGDQCTISKVKSAAAVSRYVGKYMFKASANEVWPSGWKRVRYSQNWPPVTKGIPDFVAVLLSAHDWERAAAQKVVFVAETRFDYERAIHHIANVAGERLKVVSLLDQFQNGAYAELS